MHHDINIIPQLMHQLQYYSMIKQIWQVFNHTDEQNPTVAVAMSHDGPIYCPMIFRWCCSPFWIFSINNLIEKKDERGAKTLRDLRMFHVHLNEFGKLNIPLGSSLVDRTRLPQFMQRIQRI